MRKDSLVKNGKLTIPLYHGTSNFFIQSIMDNGLGALNPVETLNVMHFLKRLYEIGKELFQNNPSWPLDKLYLEKIIKQDVTKGGFDFRHGESYLSPVELTAVKYAINNPFGSEAISVAINLYNKILNSDSKYSSEIVLNKSPLIELSEENPYPVLIKVYDIKINDLKGEADRKTEEIIIDLEVALKENRNLFDVQAQQLNFRLIHPLNSSQLTPYKIVVDKKDSNLLEYRLQKILM